MATIRFKVKIEGTRPLLQHQFGPHAIPLEKQETTGVAGNDPEEWKRTCMVNKDGYLYIPSTYIFGMMKSAAKYTKKGRGSIQPMVAATLQVEEIAIAIENRKKPNDSELKYNEYDADVYIDVCGVRNPSTKARNVRYRLACSPGWTCTFTLIWDNTIVSREQMRSVMNDASTLIGLADGRGVGNGRFKILEWAELKDAKEEATKGNMGSTSQNRLEAGQNEVHTLPS